MKTLFLTFLSLASISSAIADGMVDFRNTVTFRTPGDRIIYLGFPGGPRLTGTNYVAQLFYGPALDNLRPVSGPPAHFRPLATSLPGTWTELNPFKVMVGFNPGDTLWLAVRVYDGFRYSTWEQAKAAGAYNSSGVVEFTYTIPLPGSPPTAYFMENFRPNASLEGSTMGGFFPVEKVGEPVTLSWSRPDTVKLQQATSLSSRDWQDVPNQPTNGIYKVFPANDAVFFRLARVAAAP